MFLSAQKGTSINQALTHTSSLTQNDCDLQNFSDNFTKELDKLLHE
ncbi:hypothetical protein SECTIM467_68 [Brevibacillus phage SecTim467]|uniref:Uncharacterized protein n=1 Tax=Brevibacillus phage SecTim467 TaxID=1691956 RepID=A0A0K2CPD0_9CAUD|nr:hypothetical protein SECTIM467_68 [Brevibacillus phage SecTim467]